MSVETTTYNVYRVLFTQQGSPDHEGIALVPAQNSDQLAGRFYHVKGTVGLGMTYERKPGHRFGAVDGYKDSTFLYQISKSKLDRFEEIAAKHPPPYDPRVLTEREPHPPARNCADWVDDVLDQVKRELI
ncbi:hypothetical protein Plec18167_008761 [Paecilomyces lecythidis]|uniref:Uncharacterized protein n=1 Tax=Paecilomyces lecythidis TaxID=3004212 RepID=A0ABR3WU90_9EURO